MNKSHTDGMADVVFDFEFHEEDANKDSDDDIIEVVDVSEHTINV